jgi:hypothetical protein
MMKKYDVFLWQFGDRTPILQWDSIDERHQLKARCCVHIAGFPAPDTAGMLRGAQLASLTVAVVRVACNQAFSTEKVQRTR